MANSSEHKSPVRIMPFCIIESFRRKGHQRLKDKDYEEMLAGYEQLLQGHLSILALPDHPLRKSAKEISSKALNQLVTK